MYEQMTYETVLDGMLALVRAEGPGLDTREGSLIYTALAPAAAEMALMYIELDNTLRESFADTQSRPFLARRAAERGVFVREASPARRLGVFNIDLPEKARFCLNGLYYRTIERLAAGRYVLECETPGTVGNTAAGPLTACEYIPGLTEARLSDVLAHGADAETAEQLRSRYFQSLEGMAFGGNAADYIQKVGSLPGIGSVKVAPAWLGGGTVLLTVTGSDGRSPPPGLIGEVQAALKDKVPIGHTVTVEGAAEAVIDVTASFAFHPGYDFPLLKDALESSAETYMAGLRGTWADENETIVRISGLEQAMLSVPGVLDVAGTALNGTAARLTLPGGHIPVLGSIHDV